MLIPEALNQFSSQVNEQSSLQIRRAKDADASAISSLLYRSFLEYEALYTPEGFAGTTPAPEQILERIQEGPVWVALLNGAIVGTVSAVFKDEGLYVRGMAVNPVARGNHIGLELLSTVEEFALESVCSHLFLSTTPFLLSAIRLYERCGFCRSDEGPQDLYGTPLFTMIKKLSCG